MTDKHNYPKCYSRIKSVKKNIDDEKIKQNFNRYVYRYRLARAFEGINAPDIGKQTLGGYTAAMKMFLAYSAFDEIRAIKKKIKELKIPQNEHIQILDAEAAEHIRKNKELELLLKNSRVVNNNSLVADIDRFYEGENFDVMCIATAFRNTFSHGVFTAGAAGLKTKKNQKIIYLLADLVLIKSEDIANECAEYFEKYLKG